MIVKHLQALGLAAALTVAAAGMASAQVVAPETTAPGTTAPETTATAVETDRALVTEQDDGFDWGWLGLLGLLGLAGLGGRKKHETVRHTEHRVEPTRTAEVNRTNVYDKVER